MSDWRDMRDADRLMGDAQERVVERMVREMDGGWTASFRDGYHRGKSMRKRRKRERGPMMAMLVIENIWLRRRIRELERQVGKLSEGRHKS